MATAPKKLREAPVCGVGMPAFLHLQEFGSTIWSVFGTPPYLVGSALESKDWRDVDVRLILEDQIFDAWFGRASSPQYLDGKWAGLCMAFSALGQRMTGLPIDFQIQRQSEANKRFDGPRMGLGLVETRLAQNEAPTRLGERDV